MRSLVFATLLVLTPTLALATPTWSTAFAPVGLDEPPQRSAVHSSSIVLQGPFTRLNTTALQGLGTWDGSVAGDLGASLAAYLAGTGNLIQRLGEAISWNGELVVYCQYGPAPNVTGGRSLFAFDGTDWRQLPDPSYPINAFPRLYTVGTTLVVNVSFSGQPDGARIGLLDDQENWTLLTTPVPVVTPDPYWEESTPSQAGSVAIVDGVIHAYTSQTWLEYGAPSYYYTYWRIDGWDGFSWQSVSSGQEVTNGPAMGGCCETVWGVRLQAVGSQLFRYTSSGYASSPDHSFEEYVGGSSFSTTDMMPTWATSIDHFAPAVGGVVATGVGTDGNWVGFFDGSAWTLYGEQIYGGSVATLSQLGGATFAFGDFTSIAGQDIAEAAVYENGAWAPAFGISLAPLTAVRSIVEYQGAPCVAVDGGQLPGAAGSVAAWDGNQWQSLGEPGLGAVPVLYPWNGDLLAGRDTDFCAGGTCERLMARFQAGVWSSMGDVEPTWFCYDVFDCFVISTSVEDFAEFDGALYASGTFTESATGSLPSGVAVWSSGSGDWVHPGPGLPALTNSSGYFSEPWVFSLDSFQGYLLIGGQFNWNAQSANSLLGYDGAQTIPLGSSLFAPYSNINPASVVDMLVMPDGLYICGRLLPATPSDPRATIAFQTTGQFPDGTWTALGSGVDGSVEAMIPYEDGILVGGQFSSAGGVPCNSIAYWDGEQWSAPIDGVTDAVGAPGSVRSLAKIGNDLHVGGSFTFAGGVPSANYAILEQVTTVAAEPAPPRARTALLGVHPNPFNPSTQIRFSLQDPAGSHLDLYDAAGRHVRRFDLSNRGAGEGSVQWNGTDTNGRRVSSGVYFVRLESNGLVDQTRVVLLK